jgi:hypothetical protein
MAGPVLRIKNRRSENARGSTSCKVPLRKVNFRPYPQNNEAQVLNVDIRYSDFLSRRLNFRGKEFGKDEFNFGAYNYG